MTYLGFHAVFILPPIVALALALRARRGRPGRRELVFLPVIAVIALVYTTPWDNYLVYREVWGYGADRVIGTIGWVPVEEYIFFVLQPLLTGLWLFHVLAAQRPAFGGVADRPPPRGSHAGSSGSARLAGALLYLALGAAGVPMLMRDATTYLGLILVWAAPVLAAQWAYAGHRIWAHRRSWALAVAVPTLYLWVADALAIRFGIWEISERFTVGLGVWTLPLEEAVFFLVTNLLVVQGLLLFLDPAQRPQPGRGSFGRRRPRGVGAREDSRRPRDAGSTRTRQ